MTEETIRPQSVSRRILLSGTAGLLGGAALSSGAALAQNTAPASPGAQANSPPSPSYANPAWLALRQEEIIEPGLEIVDPHHHLWDRPGDRFLLDQLLADTNSGHNIAQTVFIECGSMYRADGPAEMKPVGETEFANGVAAMSASGLYGPTRACAGIVSYVDMTLGARARAVLEAHVAAGNGRFRGIRHAGGWDPSPDVRNSHTHPPQGLYAQAEYREGVAQLGALGLTYEAWQYHPQLKDVVALSRAVPQTTMILNHCGGPLGIGPYAG